MFQEVKDNGLNLIETVGESFGENSYENLQKETKDICDIETEMSSDSESEFLAPAPFRGEREFEVETSRTIFNIPSTWFGMLGEFSRSYNRYSIVPMKTKDKDA
eukprot:CAMPEP_0184022226 /NCGR_PEP_ID=MMETSP0954-20121128/10474_1 /TAXON_ID=627963 /ORGANISM="Aplanochytrium sp, Strain PBS07" /LENGTH=103 /DNA_ID=CAMNT_0026304549 /DNA_START=264 /DNA_END=575 /DNA_ORIENTATION=+